MILFLTLVSSICWFFVCIEMVYLGNRDKTYGMPLFALGLDFAWETIYTIDGVSNIELQTFINGIRLIIDILIIVTYFRYGRERFPDALKKQFVLISSAVFAVCFAFQFAFYFQFDFRAAALYSAFMQNSLMSLLFVYMFLTRTDTRGQALSIAVVKCIGTLILTVLYGYIEIINPYVLICGVVSFSADICYFLLLFFRQKRVKP
jgi:hypothetical protein